MSVELICAKRERCYSNRGFRGCDPGPWCSGFIVCPDCEGMGESMRLKIKELEAIVEHLKSCRNCKHNFVTEISTKVARVCVGCVAKNKWEIQL